MKKTDKIKKTIVSSRTYRLFTIENGSVNVLAERTYRERPTLKELEEEFGLKKIFVDTISENKTTYECSLEDFLKIAKEVGTNETAEKTEVAETVETNENTETVETNETKKHKRNK